MAQQTTNVYLKNEMIANHQKKSVFEQLLPTFDFTRTHISFNVAKIHSCPEWIFHSYRDMLFEITIIAHVSSKISGIGL